MAITTRTGKGSPLTYAELDGNFTTLQADIATVQASVAAAGLDSADVQSIVDSDYINSRVTATLDSALVTALIDSDYVSARLKDSSVNTTIANYLNGGINTNLLPDTTLTYDLGNDSNRFNDIWLASSTIYLGRTGLSIVNGGLVVEDEWPIWDALYDPGVFVPNADKNGVLDASWSDSNVTINVDTRYPQTIEKLQKLRLGDVFTRTSGRWRQKDSAGFGEITSAITTGADSAFSGHDVYDSGTKNKITFTIDTPNVQTPAPNRWTGRRFGQEGTGWYRNEGSWTGGSGGPVPDVYFGGTGGIGNEIPVDIFAQASDSDFYMLTDANKVYHWSYDNDSLFTATLNGNLNISSTSTEPVSIWVDGDGSYLLTLDKTDAVVRRYSLSTPYTVTSGSHDSAAQYDVSSETTIPTGMMFDGTGTKMVVVCDQDSIRGNYLLWYDLDSAWNPSTATYDSDKSKSLANISTFGNNSFVGNGTNTTSNPTAIKADTYGARVYLSGTDRYMVELDQVYGSTSNGIWDDSIGLASLDDTVYTHVTYTDGAGHTFNRKGTRFTWQTDATLKYAFNYTTGFTSLFSSIDNSGQSYFWTKKIPVTSLSQIPYVPADPADWVTVPTSVDEALNKMSAILKTLNSGPIP